MAERTGLSRRQVIGGMLVAGGTVLLLEANRRSGGALLGGASVPTPIDDGTTYAPVETPTPVAVDTPTPDPTKNRNEVAALREGEAHTFTDFDIDVFVTADVVGGNDLYVAAATFLSPDGTRRIPYAVISNAQCLYQAATNMDEFKNGKVHEFNGLTGEPTVRTDLKGSIRVPKMIARAGRTTPVGRVLELSVIEDASGTQVSCGENNILQEPMVSLLTRGKILEDIPSIQQEQK
jgi:hypothetical protein